VTKEEMQQASGKAGELRDLLDKLEPSRWSVSADPPGTRFPQLSLQGVSDVGVYALKDAKGWRFMNFLVKAKNDLPAILEYLQALEERVEVQQHLIRRMEMDAA